MKATKQYFPLFIILHQDRLISKEWTEWSFKFVLIEPLYEYFRRNRSRDDRYHFNQVWQRQRAITAKKPAKKSVARSFFFLLTVFPVSMVVVVVLSSLVALCYFSLWLTNPIAIINNLW